MKNTVYILFAFLCVIAGCSGDSGHKRDDTEGVRFSVPSDPKAKYYLLAVEERGETHSIVVTKRVGPSGTHYSRRFFHCEDGDTAYMGDGATIEEMNNSKPDTKFSPVVCGSIAYYVMIQACKPQ